MNEGVQLKNFRIARNISRNKFFATVSIVSDVAIMQRAYRRLNRQGWLFAPEAQENFKIKSPGNSIFYILV